MNKNTIIGFVLIGVIMFGFSWYQSKQYKEQMAAQAQLDSIAMVEQLQQMAMDSVQKATGENKAVAVMVENQAVYKDSLLNVARNAQEQILALANDKIKVEFTTILLAVGFSSAIGIFFGIYPARRAAKMLPIEALRRD